MYLLITRLLELWTKEVLSAFNEVIGNCNKVKTISMTIMNMQDHESLLSHSVSLNAPHRAKRFLSAFLAINS